MGLQTPSYEIVIEEYIRSLRSHDTLTGNIFTCLHFGIKSSVGLLQVVGGPGVTDHENMFYAVA